jgi:hypothetical protein
VQEAIEKTDANGKVLPEMVRRLAVATAQDTAAWLQPVHRRRHSSQHW